MPHVRNVHWGEAQRLFSRALARGAERKGFGIAEWDVSGSCQSPYLRVTIGRPRQEGPGWYERAFNVLAGRTRTTLEVRMWLPCSRCGACRRRLAYAWRKRAEAELDLSSRTWFGTLTFKPAERYRLLAQASAEYGPGFDGLPESHRFRLIERVAYREVQRYWKRVRKETGLPIRYIMVAEQHSDGSLHYHALLHERAGNEVRYAVLSKQWHMGFTKWKLCDKSPRTARYVTKYLTKSNATRTRASEHYGQFTRSSAGVLEQTQRGIAVARGNPTVSTTLPSLAGGGVRGGSYGPPWDSS